MPPARLSFLWLCLVLLTEQRQQCYFTDGTPADNDFACVDNTEGASPCCGAGGVCLSTGLCFDGRGINRGSCTDQSWQSSQCAQYCLQYLYSGLWPCDNNGGYSCELGNCSETFSVPAGRLEVNTDLINSLGLDSPTATVTSAANTVTATTTETARASGDVAPASPGVTTGAAAGIGAGIGIPLLIAAAAFCALFIFERRKRRNLEQSMSGQQGAHSYAPYYKGDQGYQSLNATMPPGELDFLRPPQELDNERRVPELQGNSLHK